MREGGGEGLDASEREVVPPQRGEGRETSECYKKRGRTPCDVKRGRRTRWSPDFENPTLRYVHNSARCYGIASSTSAPSHSVTIPPHPPPSRSALLLPGYVT